MAITWDNGIITWGDSSYGGERFKNGSQDMSFHGHVLDIFSNKGSFIIVYNDNINCDWINSALLNGIIDSLNISRILEINYVWRCWYDLKKFNLFNWGNSEYGSYGPNK